MLITLGGQRVSEILPAIGNVTPPMNTSVDPKA